MKMEGFLKSAICLFLLLSLAAEGALGLGMPCKAEGQTCEALVSFVTQAKSNLSAIAAVFQLESYRALLAANAWALSVPASATVPKGYSVKVPISSCACKNGNGTSQGGPFYTVQPNDYLSLIAGTVFGGLLPYQDIAAANNITNPNKIYPGQKFYIPLPCSCQESNASSSAVHYSYVVQNKNTVQGIASEFGITEATLKAVNAIVNFSSIQAGQVIDVPLKACSSNISIKSADRNLLVANGSYAITASHCLQCSCGPRDLDLYCAPAPLAASCSSMQCKNSNLMVGNVTAQQTSGGCNVTKCLYNGYVNNTILTLLENSLQPQCPAEHVLPTLTRPPSTLPAPPVEAPSPAALSPGRSASSPGRSTSGSGTSGSVEVPATGPSGQKSTAPDSLKCISLASMLILGLPHLIHFGYW